ncbi:hypothetical protein ACFFTN_01465 [Aminobacter aganoensis]|uniref:Uncharacterized protein n=1 Tax=Aminobacter aganoensis TaxID=83264 RepID=A0A7X0KJW3_9HYPH|nr:hypothetical protein [Aminobacter aganoensis]MBB6353472.1 hypothetical protein [Aminobacter aganoensis]
MAFWRAELIKVLARLKELEGGLPGTYQPLNQNLTDIAALTTTPYGRSFLTFANEAAFKAGVNLEAGTDFLTPAAIAAAYQPLDTDLTALAGLGTAVAGDLIYSNGAATWARLAKGTALQHMRMNAGATAPEWASYPTIETLEGLALVAGDMLYATGADTLVKLAKGTALQVLRQNAALTAPEWATAREVLTANRTYYVRTDGSDSNTGLVDSSGGGFLTIQKAIDVAKTLDLGGFSVTIQVRTGTYTGSISVDTPFFGGQVTLAGDTTTPANCVISHNAYGAFSVSNASILSVRGFQVQNSAASSLGQGILVQNNAVLNISGNMAFAACTRSHLEINTGGTVNVNSGYTISGATNYHWLLNYGALVLSGQTITITGTPAWGVSFIDASNGSGATVFSATFSGAATGKRYNAALNAVVNTFGGGANYFPGNVAGTTATGGQYA